MRLHVEQGGEQSGSGDRLVVLLHGLAATGAVWGALTPLIEARGWRWIAPDLRGHGASASVGPFGIGNHAADVADLLAGEDMGRVTILGHSFGGVVAGALGSGIFGPLPARIVALGVKTDWPDADIAGALAMAARPAKVFATGVEAQERYLKVSGLFGLAGADDPIAARGVAAVPGGHALAMNPGVFSCVGPSVEGVLRAVRSPLRLAAGGADPMVNPATLRAIDPGAVFLADLPHNAHVADPAAVLGLLEEST